MQIKDILLPLVGDPTPTAIAAIEKCVAMARDVGARISAIAMETDFHVRPKVMTSDVDLAKGVRSVTDAVGLLKVLDEAAHRLEVQTDRRVERIEIADVPARVARLARLKDLSFVLVRPHDIQSGKIVEQLLFESGKPILLCPEEHAAGLVGTIDQVAIAWDHTAPAARAVADAVPLLQAAAAVRIFTVTDQATPEQLQSGAELERYLLRHEIKARFETVKFDGSSVGKVFELFVKSNAIDHLVMGAYHHSRFSEALWGGATNTTLARPPCWVLMAR